MTYHDPCRLTPAERHWDDVLRFENHEIAKQLSRDFHDQFNAPDRHPKRGLPSAAGTGHLHPHGGSGLAARSHHDE